MDKPKRTFPSSNITCPGLVVAFHVTYLIIARICLVHTTCLESTTSHHISHMICHSTSHVNCHLLDASKLCLGFPQWQDITSLFLLTDIFINLIALVWCFTGAE